MGDKQVKRMNVLLLGGTGAIGQYLQSILDENHIKVTVTTRSKGINKGHICYVTGNAHDDEFLSQICEIHWDAIVDFMSYKIEAFQSRINLLLESTDQYFYISSARVYSDIEHPIKETSPRLLDVTTDEEYLKTDEYALTKARQENILKNSGRCNYTIIRPYITYGDYRLQLGVLEKEEWLYRAMHGRTVLFSNDIAEHITTLTNGYDVAYGIFKLIGNKAAFGETFHITSKQFLKWKDVILIYKEQFKKQTGKELNIKLVDLNTFLKCRSKDLRYQVLYDRLYNRDFDTTKESLMANAESFVHPQEGLAICVKNFFSNIKFKYIDWAYEGYKDRITGDWTPFSEVKNIKQYIKYIVYRFGIKLR